LIVGGGSAGQPPAGLSCFAGQGAGEGEVSDDATSPDQKIASTLWRRLWERRGRSYRNKNPER